jgi:hypothetical protein
VGGVEGERVGGRVEVLKFEGAASFSLHFFSDERGGTFPTKSKGYAKNRAKAR